MNAYTRKHRNGAYSTRIDIPGLIKSMCWKNGKRVKCSRKPRSSSISSISPIKTRRSKSGFWKNGKRVNMNFWK